MDASVNRLQTVKISYCSPPVAVYIPAVNNIAPVGIKKQKNNQIRCDKTDRCRNAEEDARQKHILTFRIFVPSIDHAKAEDGADQEEDREGHVFGVDEGVIPEDRLGCEKCG